MYILILTYIVRKNKNIFAFSMTFYQFFIKLSQFFNIIKLYNWAVVFLVKILTPKYIKAESFRHGDDGEFNDICADIYLIEEE